jgi:hypothetical protein
MPARAFRRARFSEAAARYVASSINSALPAATPTIPKFRQCAKFVGITNAGRAETRIRVEARHPWRR